MIPTGIINAEFEGSKEMEMVLSKQLDDTILLAGLQLLKCAYEEEGVRIGILDPLNTVTKSSDEQIVTTRRVEAMVLLESMKAELYLIPVCSGNHWYLYAGFTKQH